MREENTDKKKGDQKKIENEHKDTIDQTQGKYQIRTKRKVIQEASGISKKQNKVKSKSRCPGKTQWIYPQGKKVSEEKQSKNKNNPWKNQERKERKHNKHRQREQK